MLFSKVKLLLSLCVLVSTQIAMAASPIENVAQFLCDQVFNYENYKYEEHFSKRFVEAIPNTYFRSIVGESIEVTGKCQESQKVTETAKGGKYRFVSHSGNYLVVSFGFDNEGLINDFRIIDVVLPSMVINSWNDAISRLNTFDGNTALTITHLDGSSREFRSNEMQPLGSGFKLYILGALADAITQGTLHWQDQFPITEKWKSLPSGIMQTWPNGKTVSLYDYAEHMIAISDNTATDHLLNIVGRKHVEDQVTLLKNDFIRENTPFLSTAEMFKLKWAAQVDMINTFIKGTADERRIIINENVAETALDKVGSNGVSMEKPAYIREIEWFGSTNNLCSAMRGLRDKNSPEVMKVLSQSVPFVDINATSHWKYGGYKGGSEPGVLTMTYLLQSQSGEWGCVSMAWHNEKNNVNKWVFFDLIRKVVKLSEQEIK